MSRPGCTSHNARAACLCLCVCVLPDEKPRPIHTALFTNFGVSIIKTHTSNTHDYNANASSVRTPLLRNFAGCFPRYEECKLKV